MKFVKMHGCGNDYVYLDGVTDAGLSRRVGEPGWVELVKAMSDRHKGVGSDGVIVLCPPTQNSGAQVRMRMFNSDGSESEMCGNGVRCVAKFAHDRLGVQASPMLVETGRGVLSIACEVVGANVVAATVDMGLPILELAKVPVNETQVFKTKVGPGYSIKGFPGVEDWLFVSMGNPHAVSFEMGAILVPDREMPGLDKFGKSLEHHAAFPNRANIHIARSPSPDEATVLTWERGAGVTQACGTGACAVLVAGVLNGRLNREASIRVLGGVLHVRWDETTNRVFMTGEAVDVFEGEWPER